jgi:putative membrane protein
MINMKNYLWLFLKGLFMGAADAVPGVSGGTIAFITGIYDQLIEGIKDIGTFIASVVQKLAGQEKKKWTELITLINWTFFIPLGIGIVAAFGIGSAILPTLIESFPAQVYSFFIGLIIISAYYIRRHITDHNFKGLLAVLLGLIVGVGVSLIPESTAEVVPHPLYIFLLGAIAICAMILPGLSGSYILLMFGQYTFMMNSLKGLDFVYIFAFIFGAGLGLLSFARLLSYLLKKYHSTLFYGLIGLMVGALTRPGTIVWNNIQPFTTSLQTIGISFVLLVLGAAIVLVVERIATKTSR